MSVAGDGVLSPGGCVMKVLFSEARLADVLRQTEQAMLRDVRSWDPDQLLVQSESEVVAHLVEKHTARCPVLRHGDIYADEPVDTSQQVETYSGNYVEVPATRLKVHVPYDGERRIFGLRPDTWNSCPPQADVTDTDLLFTFEERNLASDVVRVRLDSALEAVERHLGWSREAIDTYNRSLPDAVTTAVRARKEKLLRDRNMAASLGIPVRRRHDAPPQAVPLRRRKPTISRPPAPVTASFTPEPTLAENDYEDAIRVVRNGSRQLERSPSTSRTLDEEARRDLLLVALNSFFEGKAGGEVFNGKGKTDILLRVDDRNVFIAECKIWRGAKAFTKAIDQLLGYLVWRDTKAAIVLFIETRNPTEVIDKAVQALADHPRCRGRRGTPVPGERYDFVLLADEDPAREIHVALLPVVIGPAADTAD